MGRRSHTSLQQVVERVGSRSRAKQSDCRQGSSEGALCSQCKGPEAPVEWGTVSGRFDLVMLPRAMDLGGWTPAQR